MNGWARTTEHHETSRRIHARTAAFQAAARRLLEVFWRTSWRPGLFGTAAPGTGAVRSAAFQAAARSIRRKRPNARAARDCRGSAALEMAALRSGRGSFASCDTPCLLVDSPRKLSTGNKRAAGLPAGRTNGVV